MTIIILFFRHCSRRYGIQLASEFQNQETGQLPDTHAMDTTISLAT